MPGMCNPVFVFDILSDLTCYSGKGEECIPQTWDMFHEKWGFLVIFWNFAGVPFVSNSCSVSQW